MNYEEAKAIRQKLDDINNIHSNKLNSFEKNELGMIPDHIRETEEYKKAKSEFDMSFMKLRSFNSWFVKEFKKEIRSDRKSRFIGKVR